MGGCLSSPAAAEAQQAPVLKEQPVVVHREAPLKAEKQQQQARPEPSDPAPAISPPAADRGGELSKSWGRLNQTETVAVQQTLLKVSELIERFAEGNAEREAPVHALKKALQLVATDCHASYASMTIVSSDQATFLVMGAVGSSHDATTLPNLPTPVTGADSSVSRLLAAGSSSGGGSSTSSNGALSWTADGGQPPPSDWVQLAQSGIRFLHAMPIRAGPDLLLGVLNLGFKAEPCLDMGVMGPHLFATYLSLISATLTAVVRDPGLNAYVCLARDLAAASSLDGLMQAALVGSHAALTRLKGVGGGSAAAGNHTWLRLALISGDKSAAALYDDLSQAGVARGAKRSSSAASSSSAQWVASIQAAGGLVRTNIPMKNTILRIALTNKKQVLIPDVQKLINQLGNVNTDLFASRLLKPPSSVLLLPLRASGVGIFGALYCLADVHTEFSEVAKQLKEVAELLGSGLNRALSSHLAQDYVGIQQLNHEALLTRDPSSGGSLGGGPLGAAGHSSGIVTPSSVTPATTAGSLPTGPYSYSTTGSSSLTGGYGAGRSEGSFLAAASAGGALEFGSTIGGSWTGSIGGSMGGGSMGGGLGGPGGLHGRSFTTRQVASSTNAVATGITEKLNQKRIDAAMAEPECEALAALHLVAQIGEGGFAKVFRGLYRGLVVAVKVVAVGDPSNERAVMKNAHEIAILRSSSHPNIIQAYSCMTDVRLRDVVALCTRNAPRQQRTELVAALSACAGGRGANAAPGGQQQQQQQAAAAGPDEDATCHIEVVEYCDLGNLTSAIRGSVFALPARGFVGGRPRSLHHCSSAGTATDTDDDDNGSVATDATGPAGGTGSSSGLPRGRLRVNMRWLLLTLLEVAEGMGYLHRMGVVHCDLKPANVLLKSSNADVRGFTAKVSDFGLSRVEDDESCATFPFNSCGTAAYVAPEALITTKKVNASVDVYAFGVMMWELFVGQRPYGNMSQQKVVEEVVLRGLRPAFPVGTPLGYAQLAASCWHATAASRPTFQEVISRLQAMLHQAEESEMAAAASVSLTGSEAWGGRADGLGAPMVGGLPPASAAAAQQQAAAAAAAQQAAAAQAAAAAMAQQQQQQRAPLQPGPRVATSGAAAAAAAAIAEAAAQWNKQAGSRGGLGSGGGIAPDNGRLAAALAAAAAADAAAAGKDAGALQQVQAAQLLQWQQQQAQQAALLQQRLRSGGVGTPDADAAAAQQRQGSAVVAAAAAGSVYEFQQVGYGGESVVGTGAVGANSRYGAGGRAGAASTGTSSAASSTGGGGGYDVFGNGLQRGGRRAPTRSKTFTAGTAAQQYDQLVAAAAAAAAGASPGDPHCANTGSTSGTGTSLSFGWAPGHGGSEPHGQQQTAAAAAALLQVQQRQAQLLLQQGGYIANVGLIAGHSSLPGGTGGGGSFTFASAGANYMAGQQQQQHSALSGPAAAAAAAAQRRQAELDAARELLARHMAAAAAQPGAGWQ